MQTVVIYGNSLVMSSIGACLQESQDLHVLPVDLSLPDAQQRMKALRPDIVIFDLAALRPDFPIALCEEHPHLLLIGVDLTKDQALVLSSQPANVFTIDDLLQVIRFYHPGSPEYGAKPGDPAQNFDPTERRVSDEEIRGD